MADFNLNVFPAEGKAAKLVTQADTKDRHTPRELANAFNSVGDRLGIAWAVREKNAIRPQRKHIFGGSIGRNNRDVAIVVHKQAKNIQLDSVIVSDHFEFLRVRTGAGFVHLLGPGRSGEIDRAV